jgi:hypothetical protein
MTAAYATGQDESVSPPVDERCLVEYPEVERRGLVEFLGHLVGG